MINYDRLKEIARVYPFADYGQIREAQEQIGLKFPPEYVELLQFSDGLNPTIPENYDIGLFPTSEIVPMNKAYEVNKYFPDFLFIGLDGGGRGFFLTTKEVVGQVYLCPMGALFIEDSRLIANNLEQWISNNFDLKDPLEIEHPDYLDIYLVKAPTDGIKGLYGISQQLGLSIQVNQLKPILQQLPYRLAHKVPYLPYSWKISKCNEQYGACLALFEANRFDHPIFYPQ